MSEANIEKIDISQTLPVISCDYESLRQWAIDYVSRYKDLVITEEQVKDIKKDMAEINKAKKNLDRARIDAVRAVSEPIRKFEANIKEVGRLFELAYNSLADQVKAFYEAEREKKRAYIQSLIDEDIKCALRDWPGFEGRLVVEIPEKWLNKSFPIKDIKDGIYQSITGQFSAERQRKRMEKAQAERRLLIENTVKAANQKFGSELPLYPFMEPYFTDLDKNADDIVKVIEKEAKEQAETLAELRTMPIGKPAAPDENISPNRDLTISEPQQTPNVVFRLTATYAPEQEEQLREILNRNNFLRIKRQLEGIGIKVEISREMGKI